MNLLVAGALYAFDMFDLRESLAPPDQEELSQLQSASFSRAMSPHSDSSAMASGAMAHGKRITTLCSNSFLSLLSILRLRGFALNAGYCRKLQDPEFNLDGPKSL